MHITELTLKNFRCFSDRTFNFDSPLVIIKGSNGSGKTTLLEALYYACFLRTFKTNRSAELININQDYFFIGVDFIAENNGGAQRIQAGFQRRQ